MFLQEKGQLQKKLQECEQRLRLLELTDTTDGTVAKRYKKDKTIPAQGRLSVSFIELLIVSHSLHQ